MAYIEICGGIATGKSTLCKKITEKGIYGVFENFHENPFWRDFYKNPHMNVFETEMVFQLQHYNLIKRALAHKNFVCDFSLIQDLSYADINLVQRRHRLFCDVADELRREIGFPDVLIHVYCPEAEQLERIRKRQREPEGTIKIDYLSSLNRAIEDRLSSVGDMCDVIHLDSSKIDFRSEYPQELARLQFDELTVPCR